MKIHLLYTSAYVQLHDQFLVVSALPVVDDLNSTELIFSEKDSFIIHETILLDLYRTHIFFRFLHRPKVERQLLSVLKYLV